MKQVDLGGPQWPTDFPEEDREVSASWNPTWGVVPACDSERIERKRQRGRDMFDASKNLDPQSELTSPSLINVYIVDCSTGCSCCRSENHERGPFSSRAVAEARVERYRELRVVASQYAPRGSYCIYEQKAEVLPDGRLIADDRVYKGCVDEATPGGFAEKIEP